MTNDLKLKIMAESAKTLEERVSALNEIINQNEPALNLGGSRNRSVKEETFSFLDMRFFVEVTQQLSLLDTESDEAIKNLKLLLSIKKKFYTGRSSQIAISSILEQNQKFDNYFISDVYETFHYLGEGNILESEWIDFSMSEKIFYLIPKTIKTYIFAYSNKLSPENRALIKEKIMSTDLETFCYHKNLLEKHKNIL